MKIKQIGDTKRIISNLNSRHNYFGQPSVARLQNGKIMVAASGFRINHICPFGKAIAVMSYDNGKTWDMENNYVHENKVTFDMGYPCTCEMPDGTLLTVFYGYLNEGDSANIFQQKWTFEK